MANVQSFFQAIKTLRMKHHMLLLVSLPLQLVQAHGEHDATAHAGQEFLDLA